MSADVRATFMYVILVSLSTPAFPVGTVPCRPACVRISSWRLGQSRSQFSRLLSSPLPGVAGTPKRDPPRMFVCVTHNIRNANVTRAYTVDTARPSDTTRNSARRPLGRNDQVARQMFAMWEIGARPSQRIWQGSGAEEDLFSGGGDREYLAVSDTRDRYAILYNGLHVYLTAPHFQIGTF
jgi:hypothetical protein